MSGQVVKVDKLCVDKLRVRKLCVDKLCEDRLCVGKLQEEEAGGGGGPEAGVQNQKQEPHTKMWGKTRHGIRFIILYIIYLLYIITHGGFVYIYIHQFFVAILAQDFKAIFACFRDLAFFLCIISAAMATFELVPDFTESSGENGPESFGIWQLQEIAQLQEESSYASPRNTWTARRGR